MALTDELLLQGAKSVVAHVVETSPAPSVMVSVDHGCVKLRGNVATAEIALRLDGQIQAISGVSTVIDELVDDDTLLARVRDVIGAHEDIAASIQGCHAILGTVYIDWSVRCPAVEQSLRDELLAIRGVRAVVNGTWSSINKSGPLALTH